MSARLVRESYDATRMYEWAWLQREKDHRGIDARVIGLVPITPISTLVFWPLAGLPPLTAKRIWLVLNIAFLAPIFWLLHSMTALPYRRIGLAFALSFPLQRNLLYGQFYVLLLLLVLSACWAYSRQYQVAAGTLIAVAAAFKIFPVMLFIFYLQRRAWRALAAGVLTALAAFGTSAWAFGWGLHRTYLVEVMPWTIRGEGLPPYATTSASISSVLHYLFLAEPQWNPHPWHSSPLLYGLLQPTLQWVALAPAILLIDRKNCTHSRILMEWSGLLVATLAISTIPASYNFVLITFPACVVAAELLRRKWYRWLGVLVAVYLGIGFPMSGPAASPGMASAGLKILLYVPRLPLMFALLLGIYLLLWHDRPSEQPYWNGTRSVWTAALILVLLCSVHATIRQQRLVRQEYAYRLPLQTDALLEAHATNFANEVRSIAMTRDGYHLERANRGSVRVDSSSEDDLSYADGPAISLVERVSSPVSQIVELEKPSNRVVENAHDPAISTDGNYIGYLRDDHGRAQLIARRRSATGTEIALTPRALNVYDVSYLSDELYAVSAAEGERSPQIYLTDATHTNAAILSGTSRYPALSPDGHWMAYSNREHGLWNLWLRDQRTGATHRVGDVPCNQIEPAWETDSKTLLYGTDCGRSLWFTAIARRRVIP